MNFQSNFQAKVTLNDQPVHEFAFTVNHDDVFNGLQAAIAYLQSLNDTPGEVFANSHSGYIKNDDGHICWFYQVL